MDFPPSYIEDVDFQKFVGVIREEISFFSEEVNLDPLVVISQLRFMAFRNYSDVSDYERVDYLLSYLEQFFIKEIE